MVEVDLDYDDDLKADAAAFGQQLCDLPAKRSAQGVVEPQPQPPSKLQVKTGSLEEALYIAREVYGETNSVHSELFYKWVQAVLEGGSIDIKATEEMLMLLHKDKENFGGRISWVQYVGKQVKAERLQARRHASICAMNIVRAVLNKARGCSYMLWVQRSLWRAVQTEKDVKSER